MWVKQAVVVYRNESLSITTLQGYIFCGTGERNRGYALLMTANKPETVLYRAPTVSLLFSLRHTVELVHVRHWCGSNRQWWFIGMNLSQSLHSKAIYSVAQEREIEGMLC